MTRSRLAPILVPTLVLLVSFAGCLGGSQQGEGCACRPEGKAVPAGPDGESGSARTAPEPGAGSPGPSAAAPEAEIFPAPAAPEPTDESWTRSTSRAGTYEVCWRARGGTIARNEDFTLEVRVLRGGKPVPDAKLSVSAWMPDHGHGMLRAPRTVGHGDGSFEIEGMLLHMRGHWQLFFEVLEGTLSETAEFDLHM